MHSHPLHLPQAGLELLAHGRAADRADNWGDALASLTGAAEVFAQAAELDPGSPRTLGNWGNALLQLGKVRVAFICWLSKGDTARCLQQEAVAMLKLRVVTRT